MTLFKKWFPWLFLLAFALFNFYFMSYVDANMDKISPKFWEDIVWLLPLTMLGGGVQWWLIAKLVKYIKKRRSK